jgi:ABC-type branched-subunit amino acid transport system substrate-binding protein
MNPIRRRAFCAAAASAPWIVSARGSEPGVSDNKVVFGQTIGFDSVWGSLYRNYTDGLLACFAQVNAQGGVHGRQLSVVRREDNYVIDKALTNVRAFGQGADVFGLACIGGTGITLAAMPLLEEYRLPAVGTLTGADGARVYNRYLFHTRTAYSNEVEKMVEHLATIGTRRIAVVYQDNAFGKSTLAAAHKAAQRFHAQLVADVPHPAENWDGRGMAATLVKAAPQAVLLFTSPSTVADLMKQYKAQALAALPSPWVLSVTSVPKLFELLEADVRGIAITQVMPHPLGSSRAARNFRSVMARHGNEDNLSYETLEGFMTGRVIVEGLRRAGRNLTRDGYIRALESFELQSFDELDYRYTASSHLGPSFVEVTLLGAGGTVLR